MVCFQNRVFSQQNAHLYLSPGRAQLPRHAAGHVTKLCAPRGPGLLSLGPAWPLKVQRKCVSVGGAGVMSRTRGPYPRTLVLLPCPSGLTPPRGHLSAVWPRQTPASICFTLTGHTGPRGAAAGSRPAVMARPSRGNTSLRRREAWPRGVWPHSGTRSGRPVPGDGQA